MLGAVFGRALKNWPAAISKWKTFPVLLVLASYLSHVRNSYWKPTDWWELCSDFSLVILLFKGRALWSPWRCFLCSPYRLFLMFKYRDFTFLGLLQSWLEICPGPHLCLTFLCSCSVENVRHENLRSGTMDSLLYPWSLTLCLAHETIINIALGTAKWFKERKKKRCLPPSLTIQVQTLGLTW